MTTDIEFIPECNADTALLLTLGIHLKHVNKADNNSKIAKAMQSRSTHFHKKMIGLTDMDKKNIPTYFDKFEMIRTDYNVFYKRNSNTQQYIIFLKPAVESWLIEAAKEVNISIKDYGFSDNVKELKKITTHEIIKTDESFRRFIKDIKNAQSLPMMFFCNIIKEHYEIP